MRAAAAVIALAATALALPAEAHPPALVDRGGVAIQGKRHTWLHQARAPLVNGRIRLISASCPGQPRFAGCVFTRRPRTLWIRPGARNEKSVIYHERGHAFDLTLLRHRDRRAFKRALGIDRAGWFNGDVAPSELFAEAYALCGRFGMRRPPTSELGWTRSVYGYRPSRTQHRTVCGLVARAGTERRRRANPRPQPPPNAPRVIEQKPPQPAREQPPQEESPAYVLPQPPLLPLPLPTIG